MRRPKERESEREHLLFALSLLFFSLWGCSQWEGRLPEHVLAQVNEEQITVNEFEGEFKELMLEPGKEGKGEGFGGLKEAYLDQMIERKILAQEARRLRIKVSPEELNQAIFEVRKDYPKGAFDERLGLKGTTLEEWQARMEERLLAEKMARSAVGYGGEVDERETFEYYETYRASFQLGQKVRARQIVVADGEEAIQVLKRLKKGESFEKMAKERSLGPEKVNGGDLGYFRQGEKPAEFDSVFAMEVGAISEVIKSPYGYHIFKLEEKIEARQIPFEEAKAGILQKLRQKKGEEEYQRWLKGLRGKANVKVNKRWFTS